MRSGARPPLSYVRGEAFPIVRAPGRGLPRRTGSRARPLPSPEVWGEVSPVVRDPGQGIPRRPSFGVRPPLLYDAQSDARFGHGGDSGCGWALLFVVENELGGTESLNGRKAP